MSGTFLKHLNARKQHNVIVAAEDEDFDNVILGQLRSEGFNIMYVPMGGDGGANYVSRLHAVASQMTGINESYAIVAYGDAAGVVLEHHVKATPRLRAIVAYYPSAIPDPTRAHFPMGTAVMVHLAGDEVKVRRRPGILGFQGKAKLVRKRIRQGIGLGGNLKLTFPSFKYENAEPGFAEHDLEEFNSAAESVSWSRTLEVLRDAFGIKVAIDDVWDQFGQDAENNLPRALDNVSANAEIVYAPSVCGAANPSDLKRFYADFFRPTPRDLNAQLLSRTRGADRVVDEIKLEFEHDTEIPWLLPGVPATHKDVSVVLVSIVCIKGGIIAHEHVYWDQASVLLQVGLLDPRSIPSQMREKGVKILPVAGRESVQALTEGFRKPNTLMTEW